MVHCRWGPFLGGNATRLGLDLQVVVVGVPSPPSHLSLAVIDDTGERSGGWTVSSGGVQLRLRPGGSKIARACVARGERWMRGLLGPTKRSTSSTRLMCVFPVRISHRAKIPRVGAARLYKKLRFLGRPWCPVAAVNLCDRDIHR